jgi:hypothetical protein
MLFVNHIELMPIGRSVEAERMMPDYSSETRTGCRCETPGWCERHQCSKPALLHRLCRENKTLYDAWESGCGPGQVTIPDSQLSGDSDWLATAVRHAGGFGLALVRHLWSGATQATFDLITSRLEQCLGCTEFDQELFQCRACGCQLRWKLAWKQSACPLGKW